MPVKKNIKLAITKKDYELQKQFEIRKLFIELLQPKNKKEFSLYEMYSHIFVNIIYLKCHYSEKTEKFIKDFIKKYKKEFINSFTNILVNNIL